MHGRYEKIVQNSSQKISTRRSLGVIILKCIFKCMQMWTVFLWFMSVTMAGCCEHGNELSLSLLLCLTFARFQVLQTTSMKMAVFWDVAPCSMVDTDRRFRELTALVIKVMSKLHTELLR
jgi:hypothetical protein